MSRKRRLVDKINEEFEKLVGDKQQRQYSQYMRAINNDVVDEMPKSKKQLRKIINRHQLNPNTSIKMFSVMNGVQNLLLNPPTRESRKKLKPLEGLMRVYNVNNPKSFANAMYQMTTGQKQSDRNKRFRPLLLSYYDGFTENIETLEQQAQRAMKRAELEMQSTLFADMEELRRERLPITQVKKRLLEKYNDPKRIRRALDTELHEQAERVKLEQSKFMGYTHKKWNTQSDERVRRTKFHNQVANKVIPVDSQFKGGGIKADYPGDIDLPVGERINCRCYITYHNKPQAVPTSAPIIAPPRRRTSTQALTPIIVGRKAGRPIRKQDFKAPPQLKNDVFKEQTWEAVVEDLEKFDKSTPMEQKNQTHQNLNYLYQNFDTLLDKVTLKDPKNVRSHYNPSTNTVNTTLISSLSTNLDEIKQTYIHEFGHALDNNISTKVFGVKRIRLSIGATINFNPPISRPTTGLYGSISRGSQGKKNKIVNEALDEFKKGLNPKQLNVLDKSLAFEDAVEQTAKIKNQVIYETKTFKSTLDFTKEWKTNRDKKLFNDQVEKGYMSDIIDALTRGDALDTGKVIKGHGSNYYKRRGQKQAEIFTELGQLRLGFPDDYKIIKNDFPEMVNAYEDLIDTATDYLEEEVVGKT